MKMEVTKARDWKVNEAYIAFLEQRIADLMAERHRAVVEHARAVQAARVAMLQSAGAI